MNLLVDCMHGIRRNWMVLLALLGLAGFLATGKWPIVFTLAFLLCLRACRVPGPVGAGRPGSPITLDHENNFNIIRVLLAWGVLYQHSFPFSGVAPETWFDKNVGIVAGKFAVNLFFFISGFLVSQSLARRGCLRNFFLLRVMRIVPGLAVVVCLSVLVLGASVTHLPLAEYLSHSQTWKYIYNNVFLIHAEYRLPGVFLDNPHSPSVNGSLWSLRYEVKMYAILGLAGFLGLFFRRRLFSLFSLLFIGWYVATLFSFHVEDDPALQRVALYFYLGCLFFYLYAWLRFTWVGAALLALATAALWDTPCQQLSLALLLCYLLLWFALTPVRSLAWYRKLGDYSYGIYLCGAPIQQTLVFLYPDIGFSAMLCAATVLAVLFAVFSWHCVELPALDWARSRWGASRAQRAEVPVRTHEGIKSC